LYDGSALGMGNAVSSERRVREEEKSSLMGSVGE